MKRGPVDKVIKRLKYEGELGWAQIFGRLVVGWLDEHDTEADLIVANPTYPTRRPRPDGPIIRHTEAILKAAINEDLDDYYPWDDPDDPLLVKTEETTPSTASGWRAKYNAAQELRTSITITDPNWVRGKHILILDDVTTTLCQLDVLASMLAAAGATEVEGLVIARAAW